MGSNKKLTAVRGDGRVKKKVEGLSKTTTTTTKTKNTQRHRQQYGDYDREKRVRGGRRG